MYRFDGFPDVLHRYSMESSIYDSGMLIPDYDLAEKYQYNGLFSKIIDRPAEEALKHGIEYNISDQTLADFLDDALDRLDWEEKATTAIRWARLFGGAVIVMLLDDGRGLEEPVNWQDIRSVEELRVYERAIVQPDPNCYLTGKAEYFDISSTYGGFFRVHRSRCLVFKNGSLPEYAAPQQYFYWGLPEYVRIRRDLSIALHTHQSAANMIDKSVQPVYKQRGLQSTLAGPDGDDQVLKRLLVLDASRGMMNSVAIDMDGEDYSFQTFQLSGASEILESTYSLLSAVTCIPQTILFGRSPSGENATGESDLENYYNFVEGIQKRMLKKNIRTLLKAVVQAGVYDGSIAESQTIKPTFKPLWSLSEAEQATVELSKAQRAQATAQTAQLYIDMQVLQPDEVRQALARDGTLNIEDILDHQPQDVQDDGWAQLLEGLEPNDNPIPDAAGQLPEQGGIMNPETARDVNAKDGGKGSGNFNHEGRPGKIGGSGGGGNSSEGGEKSSEEHSTEKTSKISKKVYPNERNFKDSKIEKSVLYDDDGSVLLEKTGSERQVRFSRQELEKFRGKVFTHSHPQDVTLSPADLMRMQEYEIKQVRAVTSKGVYVAGYTGKWKKQFKDDEELKQFERSIDKDAFNFATSKLDTKEWTLEQADSYYQHIAVQKMSEELGFEYRFIPWEDAEDE
ncbi:DUF1073 domain-containing protein [Negativibacillus massiliensis]|uniref:phage portal protein n=1 Tax=Negativibacillus massiliensis TaxID=1871035 RepID=UPI003AF622BD